ncbi:MAG: serine hydrolase [Oscillospiraceae bacterium]|nr:serine hydrolase [Oscillospiraceae bacterium]
MPIFSETASLRLLANAFDVKTATQPLLPHYLQKPKALLPAANTQSLPRAAAREADISAEYLLRYLQTMKRHAADTHLHTLMVAKDGKILLQHETAPYSCAVPSAGYSFSKTVTALAVGMLMDDGLLALDDKPVELLGYAGSVSRFSRAHRLTVEHLLTMRSGAAVNEALAVTEENWAESFFTTPFKAEPGSEFEYNSINSYILAAIVCRIAGCPLTEFLQARLFEPMGITNVYWEQDRRGTEKGGWGIYLATEDMLKLGQLYLNGGRWNGKQLISEAFIKASVKRHAFSDAETGGYAYGYQLWPHLQHDGFVFSGLFGQYTFVFPQNGVVVACTAGCNTLFQNNAIVRTTNEFFGGSLPPAEGLQLTAQRKLKQAQQRSAVVFYDNWRAKLPTAQSLLWHGEADRFLGRTIVPALPQQNGIGLQPLMLQVLQNNYTSGLTGIRFEKTGALLTMHFCENDAEHILPIGIGRYVYSELCFDGERYLAAAKCTAAKNEDGLPALVLHLCFPEGANERQLKFFLLQSGQLQLEFSENPGAQFILHFLAKLSALVAERPIAGKLIAPLVDRSPALLASAAFEPKFCAAFKEQ